MGISGGRWRGEAGGAAGGIATGSRFFNLFDIAVQHVLAMAMARRRRLPATVAR